MHQYKGKLIIHTGSMFSGKTSSLKKDLNRFKIASYNVETYKPFVDTRGGNKMTVHDEESIDAFGVNSIDEIIEDVSKNKYQVIGIDEIQFLKGDGEAIRDGILELLNSGVTIVVAGLDMDYNAVAFEIIKELMPIADYVYKHHAVCTKCGTDAWVSHRKVQGDDRVLIGAETEYEPLCRSCYNEVRKDEDLEVNKNQMKLDIVV